MTVTSNVEKIENNEATLAIDISADYASQEYNKACRRLGQRMNIPGFRRGKAPRAVIEKNVGAERIKQEALDKILPPVFADCITENQLDVVASPRIQQMDFDTEKGIKVSASIELRPAVKLKPYDKLKVSYQAFKAPADAMDKELDAIQRRYTTLEPVIDRAAKADDMVIMDFTGKVDGKLIEGGTAKNYQLDLENNHFIPGFAEQLVGHKLAETFTIKVTFPTDYHDKEIAGKDAEFDITINEIKTRVQPALDDNLAQQAGDFKTLDELKEAIQKGLDNMTEQDNLFRKQKAVVDVLLEHADLELSEAMVSRELNYMVSEVKERLQQQGLKWEHFIAAQGEENVIGGMRGDAENRVKTSLIFGQIAKDKDLAVTPQEFSDQVGELAKMARVDEKTVLRQLANNAGATQSMNDQLLSQKVMDYLLTRAEFDVTGTTEVLSSEEGQQEHVHDENCNHDHDHGDAKADKPAKKPAKKGKASAKKHDAADDMPAEDKAAAEAVTGEPVKDADEKA